jgi:hypothetical protein
MMNDEFHAFAGVITNNKKTPGYGCIMNGNGDLINPYLSRGIFLNSEQ